MLKQCKRCMTMKNIRGKLLVCKRCEKEIKEEYNNKPMTFGRNIKNRVMLGEFKDGTEVKR